MALLTTHKEQNHAITPCNGSSLKMVDQNRGCPKTARRAVLESKSLSTVRCKTKPTSRHNLNHIDEADQLSRRKEIYEELHPETIARNRPGHVSNYKSSTATVATEDKKTFVADTAEKTGMAERTVRNKIQIAKGLTPEVKEVIRDKDISERNAAKLARIKDEDKQKEAAQRAF